MGSTALREIVLGVGDLEGQIRLWTAGLGLELLGRAAVEEAATSALWGIAGPLEGARLGRPDVAGSPALRLLASNPSEPVPGRDLRRPGPVGIGLTTRAIERVHRQLAASGVEFLSPPVRGVSAHHYDCEDLEDTLARVEPAGGEIVAAPGEIDDPLLGRGRAAAVMPPFGTLIEIWERSQPPPRHTS